jgi:glycosyltransferase involved in cell wall biosynthesis
VKSPLVTVGIPFFNAQSSLLDAIRSIFAQTFTDWELLLVDDGSTDGSLQIAQSIDDPRVRVFSDGQNRKLAARLNQIADLARGEYIARMDADDMCRSERLARQLNFLVANKDVDVVGSSMYILDKQKQPAQKLIVPEQHDIITKNKFKGILIAHPTVMAKAAWFRRYPYDESKRALRNEDYELWLRTCHESIYSNISEPLYLYSEFISYKLSKYAKSKFSTAKAIWQYGPMGIGRCRTAFSVGRCYLQVGVYAVANAVNLHRMLVRRRYCQLSPDEHARITAEIDGIRRTKVPLKSAHPQKQ